jgi:Tol biopolymer transport system component
MRGQIYGAPASAEADTSEKPADTFKPSIARDQMSEQQLRERYRRLLASTHFARSGRLSALLLYLLQALEVPRSGSLSERAIGIAVFAREPDWDPSIDPCVRVAMGRLRTRLAEYFEADGKDDPVQIVLAKGNYLPQIITRPEPLRDVPAPLDSGNSNMAVRDSRHIPVFVFAFCCVMFLVACLVLWTRGRPKRNAPSEFSIIPFSTEMGTQFSPAVSPDGKRIAYVWDNDQENYGIYVRSVDGRSTVRLSNGTGNDFYPAWSPQGTRVAFLRNTGWEGRLIVHTMSDGSEKTVATIDTAPGRWSEDSGPLLGNPGPAWSSDGRELIAFDQGHFGIYTISIATGERRQLTTDTQTTRDFYPRLSPDGKLLAYVHYVSHGISDLYLLPMQAGGRARQITHDRRTIRGITWATDGQSLVIASNRTGPFELWRVDVKTGATESLPSDTSQAADPAASPDGTWLAFDNSHENIDIEQGQLSETQQIHLRPLIVSLGRNRGASLSPDGKRLLFISDRSGSWQIWLSTPDGTQMRQVTHLQDCYPGSISWSPDNRHVVYDGRPAGHSSIFLLDVDTGVSTTLSHGAAEERTPSWSADGKMVYFSSDRDGSVALYRMDMASGETSLVTDNGFRAKPTSDGKWIYFSTLYGILWRMPQAGGEPARLPNALQPSSALNWTVVGNRLLTLRKSSASGSPELWESHDSHIPVRMGTVMTLPDREVFSISTSSDGLTLLVETRYQSTSDIVLRTSSPRPANEQ